MTRSSRSNRKTAKSTPTKMKTTKRTTTETTPSNNITPFSTTAATATLTRESGINKDIVIKNIDKTHPIGKVDEKGLQRRIVKFTPSSFKDKVFKKHKKNKKSLKTKRKKTTNQC